MQKVRNHLSLLIFTSSFFFLCSCSDPANLQSTDDFHELTTSIFKTEVTCDTLTLNYSLAHPDQYGIIPSVPTLGTYSAKSMLESSQKAQSYLKALADIPYQTLSASDQLTYDVIDHFYQQDVLFSNYLYFNECIRPTTGIQAQLPILLAEYNFYTKKDIDTYLALLPTVKDYFKSIVSYEKEKSKNGLFMSNYLLDQVLSQCESFIRNPDSNFLITYFNKRIDSYEGLTDIEKNNYKLQNESEIKNSVIPAYELLIDGLTKLRDTGTNNKGLCYYKNGAEYYALLASYYTGSRRSIKEMKKMLQETIDYCDSKATFLVNNDSSLIDKYILFDAFPLTQPDEILSSLKSSIENDYPALPDVKCNIQYVDPCLSEYLSPAMYLVPAMDNYQNNNIYINGNDKETLSYIYTTVAHEGYPGHLYQCIYYRSKQPDPVRNVLNFSGYDEGWATYAELNSYAYSGIDKNLADFLSANNLAVLCMYARADIGIHYDGWDLGKTQEYLSAYIQDEDTCKEIYHTLLNDPAAYLPYAIGCLEFYQLREKAEEKLGDQFSLKDFHTFLLDMGPCQFYVIEKYMNTWMDSYDTASCFTIYE